jgi:hypothetical protein
MNYLQRTLLGVHRSSRYLSLFSFIQSWLTALFSLLSSQFPLPRYPLRHRLFSWKIVGIFLGFMLFLGIVTRADSASAQLFETAESQVKTIFGDNIDQTIVAFMFGVLRIVVWVTSVGFILFAVYQAQRGEQWQPLMQNAFIVVAAVVVVEGMSQLFFGGAAGGGT